MITVVTLLYLLVIMSFISVLGFLLRILTSGALLVDLYRFYAYPVYTYVRAVIVPVSRDGRIMSGQGKGQGDIEAQRQEEDQDGPRVRESQTPGYYGDLPQDTRDIADHRVDNRHSGTQEEYQDEDTRFGYRNHSSTVVVGYSDFSS